MLKLFYITKDPAVARIAQAAGVDRIFVDMEYIGKAQRQGGMDTVQNHHTVEDVVRLRPVLDQAELLVRVNPVHPGSKEEIDRVIAASADVIMLPMWQSVEEVQQFIRWVDGRAKTLLLLENQAAVDCLDRVLALPGVDEIHIGLNDLSISQGKKFLFQPLADGTVDAVCAKIKAAGIPVGFGGFGRLGGGTLPAAYCSGALPAGFVHEYSVSRLLQHGADYRFEGDQTDFYFRCGRAAAVRGTAEPGGG